MVTEINLRPARPSDLFTNQLMLIPNKVYFEYSKIRNCMDGPFIIPETHCGIKYYRTAFFNKLFKNNQSIYLPHYKVDDCNINILIKLKPAAAADMKISKTEMKINYTFFLKEKNQFLGPFLLTKESNPAEIKIYLDNQQLYIIDSPFKQDLFQLKKVS